MNLQEKIGQIKIVFLFDETFQSVISIGGAPYRKVKTFQSDQYPKHVVDDLLANSSLSFNTCEVYPLFSASFWLVSIVVVQPINCEFSTLWSPPPSLRPQRFCPIFSFAFVSSLRFHELCNNVPLGKRKKGGRVMVCKRVRNPQKKESLFRLLLYCGYWKTHHLQKQKKKWNWVI